jgi:hypothetical protein
VKKKNKFGGLQSIHSNSIRRNNNTKAMNDLHYVFVEQNEFNQLLNPGKKRVPVYIIPYINDENNNDGNINNNNNNHHNNHNNIDSNNNDNNNNNIDASDNYNNSINKVSKVLIGKKNRYGYWMKNGFIIYPYKKYFISNNNNNEFYCIKKVGNFYPSFQLNDGNNNVFIGGKDKKNNYVMQQILNEFHEETGERLLLPLSSSSTSASSSVPPSLSPSSSTSSSTSLPPSFPPSSSSSMPLPQLLQTLSLSTTLSPSQSSISFNTKCGYLYNINDEINQTPLCYFYAYQLSSLIELEILCNTINANISNDVDNYFNGQLITNLSYGIEPKVYDNELDSVRIVDVNHHDTNDDKLSPLFEDHQDWYKAILIALKA